MTTTCKLYKSTNGNTIAIKRSRCGHYYMSLILNNTKITAWQRKPLQWIERHFKNLNTEREIIV